MPIGKPGAPANVPQPPNHPGAPIRYRPGDFRVSFPPWYSARYSALEMSVTNVGDVDGDGLEDIATGLFGGVEDYPDRVWVTLTERTLPAARMAGQPGWRGFSVRLVPTVLGDVATVGDVNGDGLGDIAMRGNGYLYVVFGRTDGALVDLAALGDNGFTVDGVESHRPRTGAGHGCCGSWSEGSADIVSAGDQNGDGRDDVAFQHDHKVSVLYTPKDPGGAQLDADDLPPESFTLRTFGEGDLSTFTTPSVANHGDLNGDGRDDLLLAWSNYAANVGHVAGVVSPPAGTTVDLRTAADDGTAFELRADVEGVGNLLSLGDQNGDGRRDVGLSVASRRMLVAYTPALGVKRTVTPPAAGEAEEWEADTVVEVGDQDGDGRSDIATRYKVRLSSTGETIDPTGLPRERFWGPSSLGNAHYPPPIVGSVDDRNGDGRRELVTAIADPFRDDVELGPETWASWHVDILLSAPDPVAESIEPPARAADGTLEFNGSFITAPEAGTPSLVAVPSVELQGSGETIAVDAPAPVYAGATRTRATVRVDPAAAGLRGGTTYRYRMRLGTSRGMEAVTSERSFTYGRRRRSSGPRVRWLSLSRRTLFLGRQRTTLRWQMDRVAKVAIGVQRIREGTRARGRCVARRHRVRLPARRCIVAAPLGVVVRNGRAGGNRFIFTGRIDGRTLRPGRYRFVFVAVDDTGGASKVRRLPFRVVRARAE